MEVSSGITHRLYPLTEQSQIGELRRDAVALAQASGFDDVAAGQVALVATELGSNLVKHARSGQVLLARVADGRGSWQIELISVDQGPGIDDVAAAMADGFSTVGTLGQGLGAVRRLSHDFDLHSSPDGTVILARLHAHSAAVAGAAASPQAFSVGVVAIAAPGETVCGDAWAVAQDGERASALLADGLGHGSHAAEAANAAVECFAGMPAAAPRQLLDQMHRALRATRGAAVALAQLELAGPSLEYSGAGNICGRLLSGVEDRTLATQHGTVGLAMRQVQPNRYTLGDHTLLVMHSDGLATRWRLAHPSLLRHHPAIIAATLWRDNRRGRDDATVLVLKRNSG
ncbi:transcriptional regulator [Chitiniphilus shinanonensis]|uniref:Transcriptional regulator n=1 Tax=Chitiniphilus shinanonensis TaxID=553088 RepID=A0ABQ6BZ45_9NEIS|nr:ATP-binding SpoIIE family protein phosphatase [Chitiniphilus shinanonensis]GLS05178.1 transcriptional regulator [Chitiniphilus shinanonensis]